MTDRKQLAEHHRAVCANFTRLVSGTKDWTVATPVPEWQAVDIVRHIIEWSRGLFGAAEGLDFAPIPSIDADPAVAWNAHVEQMQLLLDSGRSEDISLPAEPFGGAPLLQAVEQYYVPDVFMHSWDLARATGQASGLDQATCAAMLQGMEGAETQLRASGQFGTRQPVADDASSEDKLAAFIGRNPQWAPQA